MKINREEIDGVVHMITPCHDCIFYHEELGCEHNRIEKYRAQGKVRGTEILSFCNYARPESWLKEMNMIGEDASLKVVQDNKIKYDTVFRIKSPEDIAKAKPLTEITTPPYKIVFSYVEDLDATALLDQVAELGHKCKLLQIHDEEARFDLELQHCTQTFHQVIDGTKEYKADRIDQLDELVNKECLPIVAILGEDWHETIFISMLYVTMKHVELEFCQENIIEMAKHQDLVSCLRIIDGESLRNYS
jgi:hypothetical protein